MKWNSKADIFAPPTAAVRLLEVVLPPEAAENELGDLEEEFYLKVRREGRKRAVRWFWLQALWTLSISIKQDGVGRLIRWCQGSAGALSVFLNRERIVRPHLIGGGAAALVLLSSSILFVYEPPRAYDTLNSTEVETLADKNLTEVEAPVDHMAQESPAVTLTATAYSLRGRTASGATVRRGIIAADRRVLPLGTRPRPETGPNSDDGIWEPSTR